MYLGAVIAVGTEQEALPFLNWACNSEEKAYQLHSSHCSKARSVLGYGDFTTVLGQGDRAQQGDPAGAVGGASLDTQVLTVVL